MVGQGDLPVGSPLYFCAIIDKVAVYDPATGTVINAPGPRCAEWAEYTPPSLSLATVMLSDSSVATAWSWGFGSILTLWLVGFGIAAVVRTIRHI